MFRGSQASRDAIVQALNAVPHGESIGDEADDVARICEAWRVNIGADVCTELAMASPGYELVLPWARAMESDDQGPLGPVTFMGVSVLKFFVDAVKGFASIAKFEDGYRNRKTKAFTWDCKSSIVDGTLSFIGVFFGIYDLVTKPEDTTKTLLTQINQTTTETLNRVKDLQDQLKIVQNELDAISETLKKILGLEQMNLCRTANSAIDVEINKLSPFWSEYFDGETSILGEARGQLQELLVSNYFDTALHAKRISWATRVAGERQVKAILDNVHRLLVDGSGGLQGAIPTCGKAFLDMFRADKPFPLDDRQYYNPMIQYMADRISHQSHGVRYATMTKAELSCPICKHTDSPPLFITFPLNRMMQDAHLILAVDAVHRRAKAVNDTLYFGAFAEPSNACDIIIAAYIQNSTSVLGAGYFNCVDRSNFAAQIHGNIIKQIELMGMPLSDGDDGQGVRLVLGSDITQIPAIMVNNPSDVNNQSTYTTNVKTRWLVPASLETFDARCANSFNLSQARAAGCPAVGTFRSCHYGCGLHPDREALWPRGYVLGYPGSIWQVAGGNVWAEIRGMLTGYLNKDTAVSDDADVMALLERTFPIPNTYIMAGIKNKTFWVSQCALGGNCACLCILADAQNDLSHNTLLPADRKPNSGRPDLRHSCGRAAHIQKLARSK